MKVNAESITKENVVFFFNKYKYNSDLIFHLERRILKESYDYKKWEAQRLANSDLTRRIFKENQKLLEEFIAPAIRNPEKLSSEALQTYLLHITFFLFENNLDTYIVDELISSILNHPEILNPHILFSCKMNLGISRTLLTTDTFENTLEIFEEAIRLFPDYESCGDDTTRVHMVFCRVYEMLAFCLYKSTDYRRFVEIYDKTCSFLENGSATLYEKMWGPNADYDFHVDYLIRFFRIYGIFMAGQNGFSLGEIKTEPNKRALEIIEGWLTKEYSLQKNEGEINLMIFTYYHLLRFVSGQIQREDLCLVFNEKLNEIQKLPEEERTVITPELAFPDDNDPVDPVFSRQLNKMKLFNRSFSYAYVFLHNFIKFSDEKRYIKKIIQQMITFFEHGRYAEKGFTTDNFVIDLIKIVAKKIDNEKEFMLFIQSIFIHRQVSSSIHFGMVSSLAGICLYHVIQEKPELAIIPGVFSTKQEVIQNRIELLKLIKNAALLHDIGKIGLTHIINLQFRPITKAEYEKIKLHPEIGKDILKNIDYLEQYQDFVEGHHKFWNDEGGYPELYKLYSSPYKYLVNLVSICDMIDTTTDNLGRNYSVLKTFDEAMEEVRKGSGTRYAPELVDVILHSEGLLRELKTILSVGRSLNSFKTYQNFILPNTSFSPEDEKRISSYEEKFKDNVKEFFSFCFPETTSETIEAHLSEISESKASRIYIMYDRNNLVYGIVDCHVVTPINGEPKFAELDEIIVRKGFRRVGYGTELLNHACVELKKEGITSIHTSIFNDFSSESFFWIGGFAQGGRYLLEKPI